jgi:type I restriction enzyme, S subunit
VRYRVALGATSKTAYRPLREVAPLVRRVMQIDPDATYTELGVRSFHKGTFHRRAVSGAEFTWQELYRVNEGDLIFSNIMAWEGAVAMAQAEDDGCVGNHRMLTCACERTKVLPAFLSHYFRMPEGMAKLVSASTGTVARNRTLTAAALGNIEVPVPPLNVQERIVRHLRGLADKARQVAEHIDAIEAHAEALFLSLHHKLAGHRQVHLADLLYLFEDSVPIESDGTYPQVGVKSFGGGLFAKAAVSGTETSYRAFNRLYTDAIVLSQVKGWEGALAQCPQSLAGMFVSPEYRTFRCRPGMAAPAYVGQLMRTPWFWSLLQDATRGVGARRERTRPEQFLNIELPMPDLAAQNKVVAILKRQALLIETHAAIREANQALIPATLERVFAPAA